MSEQIVGIDLGTTFSCVGVFKNGVVEIVSDETGSKTTPSWVAFTDTERLIGQPAKNQVAMNPKNTIFEVKRLVGRAYNDPEVQELLKKLPYTVKNDGNNKPVIEVEFKGETKTFTPIEISAMILGKMKQVAEDYLGEKVSKAIVTCPAWYGDAARNEVKDAGIIAGLQVLRVINEPTASILAYSNDGAGSEEENNVVFDCGGGTHDVTIVNCDGGIYEVKATAGISVLGGADFDNRLTDHLVTEFKKKNPKASNIVENKRAIRRLTNAAESAKRILSSAESTTVEVESLHEGIDFRCQVSRAKFEELNLDLFKKTLDPVDRVLADSKLDKGSISKVIMVGGSSRIPRIQKLVSEYFPKAEIYKRIDPDQCVAWGATLQCALLTSGDKLSDKFKDTLLIDVCPLSVGIETGADNTMTVLIKRNSPIPTKKSEIFSTYKDGQDTVEIKIFEGERAKTTNNTLLGTFKLTGIKPKPRGTPQIEVTIDIGADGLIKVTACENESGVKNDITIKSDQKRLSPEEIAAKIKEAEKFQKEDDEIRERSKAKNSLESLVYELKNRLETDKDKIPQELQDEMGKALQQTSDWIDSSPNAPAEEFTKKFNELQQLLTKSAQSFMGQQGQQSQPPSSGPTVEELD